MQSINKIKISHLNSIGGILIGKINKLMDDLRANPTEDNISNTTDLFNEINLIIDEDTVEQKKIELDEESLIAVYYFMMYYYFYSHSNDV